MIELAKAAYERTKSTPTDRSPDQRDAITAYESMLPDMPSVLDERLRLRPHAQVAPPGDSSSPTAVVAAGSFEGVEARLSRIKSLLSEPNGLLSTCPSASRLSGTGLTSSRNSCPQERQPETKGAVATLRRTSWFWHQCPAGAITIVLHPSLASRPYCAAPSLLRFVNMIRADLVPRWPEKRWSKRSAGCRKSSRNPGGNSSTFKDAIPSLYAIRSVRR
jgi:hypothetical protein